MAKNKNSSFSVMDGFDFKKQIEEQEEKKMPVEPTVERIEPDNHTELIDVMPKRNLGRPKTYEEETKFISCRLKVSNYEYAKINGGRYGGVTGYINYLIEKDRGLR